MVGGSALIRGLPCPRKGGLHMVTYVELFALCLVIIGVINIALRFGNKRK